MTIRFFYHSPETAQEALAYFFSNLDQFIDLKSEIFGNEELYRTSIPGCAAGGLYVGCRQVSIGDLLRLYDMRIWCVNKTERELFYLYRVTGSPLSGMNTCQAWGAKTKKFVTVSFDHFGDLAFPAFRLESPSFFEKKVSRQAFDLFLPLKEKIEQFHKAQIKEEQRRLFREKSDHITQERTDKNGITSLMRFCETGAIKNVIRCWLKNPLFFDAVTKDGRALINFAAKDLSCLRYVIKKKKTFSYFSAIADACETSSEVEKRLDLLKQLGFDINGANVHSETPLMVAVQTFNVRALKWLLKVGADKAVKNAEGETAYDIARENSRVFDFKELTEQLKPH